MTLESYNTKFKFCGSKATPPFVSAFSVAVADLSQWSGAFATDPGPPVPLWGPLQKKFAGLPFSRLNSGEDEY